MWLIAQLLEKAFGEDAVRVMAQALPAFIAAVLLATLIASVIIARLLSWKHGAVASHKDAKIASLETMIKLRDDQLSNKFLTTPPDEAVAMIKALEARVQSITPRHLSDEQKTEIRKACARGGGQCTLHVTVDAACHDCGGYAREFEALFNEIPGWEANVSTDLGIEERPMGGVGLVVSDLKNLLPSEAMVAEGLRAAGINFDILTGFYAFDGVVSLLIVWRG